MSKPSPYYELPGDGPFQLGLIDRIQAFYVRLREKRVDATALCSDHTSGYRLQFSLETVQQFVEQHEATVVLPTAPFEPVPKIVVPYIPPSNSFRLFVSYSGPLHFEQEKYRVVGFVNDLGQSVFVSLSSQAYQELLSDFKDVPAALAFLRKHKR